MIIALAFSACEQDEVAVIDQPVIPPVCNCNCGIVTSKQTDGFLGYSYVIKNDCSANFIYVAFVSDNYKVGDSCCLSDITFSAQTQNLPGCW